jgi:trk system potassium uptake protein TrkH
MLTPAPFALYYADGALPSLLLSAGITAGIGQGMRRASKITGDLRAKEGFAIVTFGWLLFSFFGSLPFMVSGAIPSFTDAFFETISGFTTTGASILSNVEAMPPSLLFWRALTQWLGGMGFIVLSLAILPFLGVGGMQLFRAEVPGPVADRLTPRITQTAKILWGVYVLFSLIQTLLLLLGGMSLLDALCHTFATMATGGFSTRNASVGAYQSAYIDWVIIIFMFIAGVNFSLHYRALRGDVKVYRFDREFVLYTGIVLVATALVFVSNLLYLYTDSERALRDAFFQVVSIQTTTGFATADYELWSFFAQYLLLMLMFVGGSAGSTAGGIKVIRLYLVVKFIMNEFTRLLHPQAVVSVRVRRAPVSREIVTNVVGFFALYIAFFVVGVAVITLFGQDLETAIGAVAATLGNVGPGLGNVGPMDNYGFLPDVSKWTLSILMLLGRLELFTVAILLTPAYWRR